MKLDRLFEGGILATNEGLESNASTGSSTASPITFEDTPLKICHLGIRPSNNDHIGHGVVCLEIVKGG